MQRFCPLRNVELRRRLRSAGHRRRCRRSGSGPPATQAPKPGRLSGFESYFHDMDRPWDGPRACRVAPLTRPARLPSRGSDGHATCDVADAVAHHAIEMGAEVSAALLAFIAQNSTKGVQPSALTAPPGAA